MGLILQGDSDARAVWHHKHPVSWIIGLKSMSCVRALFKSGLALGALERRLTVKPPGEGPVDGAYDQTAAFALGIEPDHFG